MTLDRACPIRSRPRGQFARYPDEALCALASRVEPRDYADTARMLEHYSPAELIGFARRLDPGLTARDFADAGRQLDHIDDEAFTFRTSPSGHVWGTARNLGSGGRRVAGAGGGHRADVVGWRLTWPGPACPIAGSGRWPSSSYSGSNDGML